MEPLLAIQWLYYLGPPRMQDLCNSVHAWENLPLEVCFIHWNVVDLVVNTQLVTFRFWPVSCVLFQRNVKLVLLKILRVAFRDMRFHENVPSLHYTPHQ